MLWLDKDAKINNGSNIKLNLETVYKDWSWNYLDKWRRMSFLVCNWHKNIKNRNIWLEKAGKNNRLYIKLKLEISDII